MTVQKWTPKPAKASPPTETGIFGWMYKNLFSSPFNTLLTIIGLSMLIWAIPPMVNWSLINATWIGETRDSCSINSGACWVFVKVRFDIFMYGFYPEPERWRINLAFMLLSFASLPHLMPTFFKSSLRQWLLVIVASVSCGLCFGSLWGGIVAIYFVLPFGLSIFSFREKVALLDKIPFMPCLLAVVEAVCVYLVTKYFIEPKVALSFTTIAFIILFALNNCKKLSVTNWRWILLVSIYPVLAFFLFVGDVFGLPHIETHFWGGLFLTLVVAGTGMATAMPIGVLLALGRTSEMVIIRTICVSFIEFVRGVPLVSVLFMASVMFPLFLPDNITFDKLLRALVGVAFFYAAYIAEVIRGGLQAIPKGQFEAAEALGWTYWKKMSVIILPQTLRLVIPGLANNFLSLLKDTTLVAVIGLLDLLGIAKASLADAAWLGFTKEAYIFAGLIFWIFCFAISRYSTYLEKKYHTNYQS